MDYKKDFTIFVLIVNSSPPDKMAAILQTIISDAFSWMKSFVSLLKFVPKGPIDNNPALV